MTVRLAGCVALTGLLMGACAGNPVTGAGPYENTGTAVGVVGGAVVGSQFGRGSGRVASTVAGAAIGGLIGNRIGAALDDEDRTRAYQAQMQALEFRRLGRSGRLAQRQLGPPWYGCPWSRLSTQCHDLPAIHSHRLHR